MTGSVSYGWCGSRRLRVLVLTTLVLVAASPHPVRWFPTSSPALFAQAPGDDALVAAYGFNEAIGTTVTDASGNGHSGSISGATWSTAGRSGAALSFDGVNDMVTVPDAAALDLTTGMTLSAWVRPAALSGWRTVLLKERTGGLAYALYAHDNAPRPASYVRIGSSDSGAPGTAQLALNTWTHLATTYNGAALRLYVNGALAGTRTIAGSVTATTGALRIGGNSIWGEYFSGLIDDLRIHRRALTAGELQSLMNVSVGEAAGFHIIAYNDSVTIGRSDSATYFLELSPVGGFTGTVTPSVSGLPSGVTGAFEPPDGPPHPGPMALIVSSNATVQAGIYTITVTCLNGALSASLPLTLTITPSPDFRVSAEPNTLIVSQGSKGQASFNVTSQNGYAQSVTMGVSSLPTGTTAAFTPSSLAPTGDGTVEFNVGFLTAPGVYSMQLTATDGVITRQAAFTLTVQPRSTAGSWRQEAMGDTPALFYGAIVGDIGNIGRQRVIASGGDGVVYAYDYTGAAWTFAQMPFGVAADGEMHNGEVGPGRNDGVNRLYLAAANSGRVYEVSWVNGQWQASVMATLNGSTDIVIGYGRNDGTRRVYVSWMNGLTEFTWTGTAWQALTLSSNEPGWVHGICMGHGRNDGVNRIYTANQGAGDVFEYTWNGTTFVKTLVDTTVTDTRNVGIGEGRNDGVIRLYSAGGDGNGYEYSWTGSAWQKATMGNSGIGGLKVHATPTRARDDGLVRVYLAAANGGVYEMSWTGSGWQSTTLGQATAYMYGLDIGDALGKGTTQIYGTSYDGQAYLFEWVPAGPATVPSVLGLTQAAAGTAIANAGLVVGTVTSAPSSSVPAGRVVSQNPSGGAQAQPGSQVSFVISDGAPPVSVPDVVGLTEQAAADAIVGAGLAVGVVSTGASNTVPAEPSSASRRRPGRRSRRE